MLIYSRLPRVFSAVQMQAEVAALSASRWKQHYNTKHYEGNWSILSLRAMHGNADNIYAVHTSGTHPASLYADTPLLDACSYIKEVIHSFKCEKTSIRLMKLNAGAVIKEHTDHDMNMEAGEARLHIPVQTNQQVAFYIKEDLIPMKEGECWYLNLSLPHRVHNKGLTDRIHLVMDCQVNDWLSELLADAGAYKKETADIGTRTASYSIADKKKIIAQLRLINTPVALQMADNIEKELL